ncbi:hypothetical protein [Fluviicola taffensis]|uniref:Secretion system C-terminal sorting domain-containing protein n=1 Tax=Fluviicola taffensis (strain DSM 16823 / NCIMB 13979 / RW262) TaxID=755732 RepID=F2IHB9_FLUTR|nr:hypothetical protein [Fluviicola taffensis]AEA42674.1 hypothetical protein Fluta_0670 [Fluviicola taffensis DSM 16823]
MDPQGLSMEAVSYKSEDFQPISNEIGYYRVKLIHDNSSIKSSNPLAIEQQSMNDAEIVKAFPNPASTDLSILINSKTETVYQLTLSTPSGKTVFENSQKVDKGLSYSKTDFTYYRFQLIK